ncbi:hypothetical protein COCC4DRAFT_31628 [Bipolaris maydis ATCC 48331]|uniref:Prion-inhibition and propagation HeLo domain-containing protein n=2 Tax=Cochliobolus heterostrophus TaxID=5016 RepID=M2TIW9_COCH5|nr:uncharacterized protein COCC4DRAFT_31628 [Bipolaris maydis ATCC 48331]EMD86454.1 hypothetical protein COCHEDRAFT_1024085 [Bipolaris maydis C5]KAH7551870.1 hypothetical protein BM1_09504 [Bipolaris maydis]ENI06405.1 hypothetical protein COCC4DRAFT_31628 [Bipolaris maydis ATCC 48331]KAJ5029891.1 prion-inhibition and propagation-domain-containing protein [Bipolaris maydis]KAJ5064894.1 prion-inhibition and propagation-domain-containing protein [Bipolaris maydis]
MSDPVSLSFAIAGIPSLFISCLNCFQYIRLGRRFGTDFGFSLAKLEAAQVRLTRWGEPIGLLENKVDIKGYKDADIIKAYQWLGQIETTFEDAKTVSEKYADSRKKMGKDNELELLEEEQMLESGSSVKKLITSMRSIAKERQKHLNFTRKVSWALYGKDNFDSLIGDLVSLINNLVELFPSNKPRLKQLCYQEVDSLEKESVPDLDRVLKNKDGTTDDAMLSESTGNYIQAHRSEFRNIKIEGHATGIYGDEYGFEAGVKPGNLMIDGMYIGGNGTGRAGHVFYGKQGAQGMRSYDRGAKATQSREEEAEEPSRKT